MFVNYSNHASSIWRKGQICATKELGKDIVDIPFPNVPPDMEGMEFTLKARKNPGPAPTRSPGFLK